MKNYYYCLDINLQNETVMKYMHNDKLINNNLNNTLSIVSRYFTSREIASKSLEEDMFKKTELFHIGKLSLPVVALNESNPHYQNTIEDLNEARANNSQLDQYLDTWNEGEISRIICTTESFDEDSFPICEDESAIIFRYILREFEDDFEVPNGLMISSLVSTHIH